MVLGVKIIITLGMAREVTRNGARKGFWGTANIVYWLGCWFQGCVQFTRLYQAVHLRDFAMHITLQLKVIFR